MPARFSASTVLVLSVAASSLAACGAVRGSSEPSAVEGASVAHSPGGSEAARTPALVAAPAPAAPKMKSESEGKMADRDEAPMEMPAPRETRSLSGVLTAGVWDDNLNLDSLLLFRERMQSQEVPGLVPLTRADHENAQFAEVRAARRKLDVSLVIDATGSMGDEIAYLKDEFKHMNAELHERYPNAAQRWSLVMYRDTGDDYVVRDFDFDADPDDFQRRLDAQGADGGGDYPEAPERGLASALQHSWRAAGDTARVLFWVADAPHHTERNQEMARAIRGAQRADVHIYPVASSGVDDLTELTMRSAAQLTGGRYVFLTDDSGVGNSHEEPRIPCYEVTRLDDAILRMIEAEMTGKLHSPSRNDVVRTVGSPRDGRCAAQTVQGSSAHR